MRAGAASSLRLLFLLILAAAWYPCRGDPFSSEFTPALGDIAWDGNLHWRKALARLKLEPGVEIEIALEHELIALDYGEVQSRIAILPLDTWLSPRADGSIHWKRPGGGARVFKPSVDPPPPSLASAVNDPPTSIFRSGGTWLLWSEAEHRATLVDANWVLRYEHGHLKQFQSPSGQIYCVATSGSRITSISCTDNNLLTAEPDRSNVIELVGQQEASRFILKRDECHRIRSVENARGQTIVSFGFAPSGLLESICQAPRSKTLLEWQSIPAAQCGDSMFPFPVHLSKAGPNSYHLHCTGGLIEVDRNGPPGLPLRMRIGVRYGRILWIEEDK